MYSIARINRCLTDDITIVTTSEAISFCEYIGFVYAFLFSLLIQRFAHKILFFKIFWGFIVCVIRLLIQIV